MKFLNNLQAEKTISIDFKTSLGESRKLYWDDYDRTLSVELGNGVIQQIGQEQHAYVKNTTASTILNGTLVMVTGTTGEAARITIAPAVTNGLYRAEYIAGVTTEDIAPGEDGIITTFGFIHDIDTSGGSENWATGTILYPDPLNPGKLTSVIPSAPNLFIIAGIVTYSDSVNGSIFIRLNSGNYLRSSHDVQFDELNEADILYYNELNSRWENIPLSTLVFSASQSSVEDVGDYYQETNVESVLQEIGAHTNIQDSYIADLLSTGVYEFSGITKIDDTHFSIGAAKGYIVDNTTDHENPVISHIDYAGSGSILATNIGVSYQTQVFLQSDGTLYFESIDIPTCPSRRDRIFLGRVVHPSTIITAVEALPDFIQSPAAQLRDLWKGLGAINDKNYVYSNNTPSTNLSLALHGGTIYYNGINFVTNKKRPTRKTIASQLLLTFNYRTRTGAGANGLTVLDPTQYDDNGTLTTVPQPGATATNQRVFLAPSGLVLIQYGQQYYSNLAEAIAGLPSESFINAPGIETNAVLIGIISISKDAINLTSTYAKFHSISKFGELAGGGSGVGAAVAAQDVVVADAGNYFTSSNAEDVLQEIGYSLSGIVDTNTITVVSAGTGIDTSVVESPTQTFTYTVTHEDTSSLSGTYGTEGIQSVTVDGMGHVTGVTTNTYLTSTTQSKDFGTVIVTDNDSGYTWQDTGSLSADIVGDTVTFVSDGGIEVNIDPTADAIQFVNSDKGSSQSIFKNIAVSGQNTVTAEINDDTVTLVAGDYISITTDSATDTITIGTTGISLDWSAIQNKPDPTITLGGDLSGSVTLTDLASGTLNATINANSVALGTDTTGDYVSTLTQGTGISITGGTGETSTPTIAHGDTSSASSISSANSNGVVIQDISVTLDDYGHITASSIETVDLDGRYYTESEIDTKLNNYQLTSEKGQANGYASLGSDGLVPTAQLPSYVDDVLEFANLDSFPPIGEVGKIYVALDTNKTYRWSGSAYIYITSGAVDSVGGYTGVVSSSNLLTAIETVDGTGSGLDSDLLDGQHGSYYAPIDSPTLTGDPKAPTPSTTDNDTSIATTAYVVSRIAQDATPIAHVGTGDGAHSSATTTVSGFMSASDKIKLDGIASGAQPGTVTSVSAGNGMDFTTISTSGAVALGTPSTITSTSTNSATTGTHTHAITGFSLDTHNHNSTYQPLDGDLTAIAGITETAGLLKKTAENTWSLDTNTYITGNETITLSGDVSGSGTTSIEVTVSDDSHSHSDSTISSLSASKLTGTVSGDRGITAGSSSTSFVKYNGTTSASGQFDGGTTTPTATTRLNYGGYFYPTALNLVGSSDTSTTATHYFVETETDGYVRPKTLANVKDEIVVASEVLTKIKTVDGSGSGLDADLLDGQDGSYYAIASDLTSHIESDSRHINYSLADGTNDYLVTLSPVPDSYTAGMLINFKVAFSNTGSSTLNCNSLGAISIFKNVSQQLAAGDIKIGQIVTVIYDGTNFQIVSGSGGSSEIGDFLDIDSLAVVKSYFGQTVPDGWQWTQGQALSRELYADLFAVIGTTYGNGDGSTTFNIPSIGTNYIIKVASSGNHGIVSNPVSYVIGNYTQKSIQFNQLSAGTNELLNFSATEFMSAELTLQITQGPKFEIIKILLITNNEDIYLEQYGHTGFYTDAVISASLNNSIVSVNITTIDAAVIVKGSIQLIAV